MEIVVERSPLKIPDIWTANVIFIRFRDMMLKLFKSTFVQYYLIFDVDIKISDISNIHIRVPYTFISTIYLQVKRINNLAHLKI